MVDQGRKYKKCSCHEQQYVASRVVWLKEPDMLEERYGGIKRMAKLALYVALKAKPGKAADVEAFLKQGAEMAKAESGTVTWYGIKEGEDSYAVFDTFNDEAGREAHLTGNIAKALMAKADELFSNKLEIHKIQILADK
jgi:quinol monooxygenase YgiN